VAPSGRIHHAIRHNAEAPNVHAALAGAWYYVREATPERVEILAKKVSDCARAAGLAMQMEVHERTVANIWNRLPNRRGAELVHDNMVQIGAPEFSEADQAYGKGLQESAGVTQNGYTTEINELRPPAEFFTGGGSTDVSDISWTVPTLSMSTPVSPRGTANHSWIRAGATGSNPGHVALIAAARYLAATAIDLFTQPTIVGEIKEEFDARTRDADWHSLLPDDFQPPVIEPPDWFLRRTGQSWPPPHITWPPERIIGHTKWESLGPPIPPGNVKPYDLPDEDERQAQPLE
jgi:aminobenzoyl-glutamate utilization protein B